MNKKLPAQCPSCSTTLSVTRLYCDTCSTAVEGSFTLPVFAQLSSDEQQLGIDFIISGGNLKELAGKYGVSYPTIRNRIDALIDRLNSTNRSNHCA